MYLKRSSVLFVSIGLLFAGVSLQAAPISWQLANVTFSDGATGSGSFVYDAASDTYSDWDISVTAGLLTAYDYLPTADGGFVGIHSAAMVDFVAFPPDGGRFIRLTFESALTDAGGAINLLTDNSGFDCNNCAIMRFITGGEVDTVPEPSSLILIPTGLAIVGLRQRLGKRG